MVDREGQKRINISAIFRVSYVKRNKTRRINAKKRTEISKN